MSHRQRVIIMRGPSGAGKSHYVRNQLMRLGRRLEVCSVDPYLVNEDGERDLDRSQLLEAQGRCVQTYINALHHGSPEFVVVDNPNILWWEMAAYYQLAANKELPVRVVELVPTTIEQVLLCAKRSKYQLPPGFIFEQTQLFEPLPKEVDDEVELTPLTIWEGFDES